MRHAEGKGDRSGTRKRKRHAKAEAARGRGSGTRRGKRHEEGEGEERVNVRHVAEMSFGSRDHSVSTKRKHLLTYIYLLLITAIITIFGASQHREHSSATDIVNDNTSPLSV